MNTATTGVQSQDDGVASALFNTMQQVGVSVGTAVLSTIAATAATSYTAGHRTTGAGLAAQAPTHSYAVAFAVSAGAIAVGAVLAALLFPARMYAAQVRETTDAVSAHHVVS